MNVYGHVHKNRERIRENKKKGGGGQTHKYSTVSLAGDTHNVGRDKYYKTVTSGEAEWERVIKT